MTSRMVFIFGSLIFVAGCAGPVPTEGTVFFNDKPLANATIQFVPEKVGQGAAAIAVSDAQGVFRMATVAQGQGVVSGSYKVVVTAGGPKQAPIKMDPDPAAVAPPPVAPTDVIAIPSEYGNAETTPLTVTIPARERLEFKIKS